MKKRHTSSNLVETSRVIPLNSGTSRPRRNLAIEADSTAAKSKAEDALTRSLRGLFAIAESYPDLKANEGFLSLQRDLSRIEDDIANARRYYNAVVRDFNTRQEVFPANLLAGVLGFETRSFFQAEAGDDQPQRRALKVRESALLFAGLLALGLDAAAIEIGKFDVSILLDPDGTLFVTETIDVDFGELERHGIFRIIPVSYARNETLAGVPVGTTYAVRMKVLGVADGGGARLRFTAWPEDRSLFIRIGDPDRTVMGGITYVITYRVQRAINRFESHDELYWNVTGTEWDWPIHKASVRVHLPSEVAPEDLLHKTFTGTLGSQTTKATERLGAKTYGLK
jgi:LemA protein